MSYTPGFKPAFFKDLAKLPREIRQRCDLVVQQIIIDPFEVPVKKLGGFAHLYRYRLGDYRLVYYVDQRAKKILFLLIAHRKEVYRYLHRVRLS